MRKNITGFTIVELLIVIVVIGILAAIVIVAYSGVQARALNASRVAEVKAWQKSLESYYAINSKYPAVSSGNYCLGTGFPGQKCRDYLANNTNTYAEANSVDLMNALKTTSSLPGGPHDKPVGSTVGPYLAYWETGYEIIGAFSGGATDCPSGLSYMWNSNGLVLCYIEGGN
jgi:general secretion pathway protein G